MDDRYLGFTYDGVHSSVMGLTLQAPMVLAAPVPRVETITIPGRHGVLTRWDGTYLARTLRGDFFALGGGVERDVLAVSRWLVGSHGQKKLVTDDDTQHYLLATPDAGAQSAIRLGLLAPFSLSFTCDPRRFLVWGDDEIDVTESRSVYNPTDFAARPLIFANGEGVITIGIAGAVLTLAIPEGGIWYDADTSTAYTEAGNANALASVTGDVVIPGGYNDIEVTGNASAIKIIPRWWEL